MNLQKLKMLSIIKNYESFAKSNENAITFCNDKKILQTKTYKEVICLTEDITELLTEFITHEHICLGLLMNHNVYVPSIILSLMKSKHAFAFLVKEHLDKTVVELKLNWILTLNDTKNIDGFKEVYRHIIDNKDSLVLWNREPEEFEEVSYQNIFCVVQTSGSTGESKIIKVPHACIEANISALTDLFGVTSKDVIFWGTPLTFDPSLVELLLALQNGASLVIVPYIVWINPYSLYEALFNVKKITVLQMVPSIFLRWYEDQIKNILISKELRVLAFGGEIFPKYMLKYKRETNLRVFNLYGISEVSCWAMLYEIKDETLNDDISIGQSLDETLVEVRDHEGKQVTCGEGEVFIGSSSRICFLNDEIPTFPKERKLKFRETGDIARIDEKGIFLLRRRDKVIKRFGHRIDLTEMESTIFKEIGLENRCIWSSENNKILTFVLIKNADINFRRKTLDKLRVKLMGIFPDDSFPDSLEILEKFPLTPHGKVDERALERLYFPPRITFSCVDAFRDLWCKYFGIDGELYNEIKDRTFFEMGGSSIAALQFIRDFEEIVNLTCLEEIYKNIFERSLEQCLNCLKTYKPAKKRNRGAVVFFNDNAEKKPVVENGLEILWSYNLKACIDGSPLVFKHEDSTYIAVGSYSRVFSVVTDKGETIYDLLLPDAIESSPTLSPCGNFLLVGCFNGVMYCIDFVKKCIVWEYATEGKIKSSAFYCANRTRIVFGSYDKSIHCISAEDGTKVWSLCLEGSIASTPIYDEAQKKIFAATTGGICFCLGEESGEVLWKYECGGPVFGTPCFLNSKEAIILPIVQGFLQCLSTNGELLWTYATRGHIFSSLKFFNDRLIFGCHDKYIYVAKVSLSLCDVINKIAVEAKTSSTPFVCNSNDENVIVSACNSGMINVINLESCKIVRSVQLPGEVFSSPYCCNGKIYVGCRDNNLYCINMNVPKQSVS